MPGHEAIPGITCLLRHQVGHAGFTLITHHQWGSADGCHLRHNFLVAAQTRQLIPVAVSAFGSAHNAVFYALLKQRCPLFRILNLPKFGYLCQSGFAALCMFRAQLIKLFADVPGDILACFFRILCDHFSRQRSHIAISKTASSPTNFFWITNVLDSISGTQHSMHSKKGWPE